MMASEMAHKFKIGQTVYYHPKDRMLSTARGTYTVTGLMPALEGQQREYRIRHEAGRLIEPRDQPRQKRGGCRDACRERAIWRLAGIVLIHHHPGHRHQSDHHTGD